MADDFPNLRRSNFSNGFVVPHVMLINFFIFEPRYTRVSRTEFIQSKGDHIGHARNKRGQKNFGVADLTVNRVNILSKILRVLFRCIPANDIAHRFQFFVALANILHRIGIVFYFRKFGADETLAEAGLVLGREL